MTGFIGGSAAAMASQIAEGLITADADTLRGLDRGDLSDLMDELSLLERQSRRPTPGSEEDVAANQARSLKLARLAAATVAVLGRISTKGIFRI